MNLNNEKMVARWQWDGRVMKMGLGGVDRATIPRRTWMGLAGSAWRWGEVAALFREPLKIVCRSYYGGGWVPT